MQNVFVVDQVKQPLMPCPPQRARKLLEQDRATVWRQYPFTIMLLGGVTGGTQDLRLKIDPGSRTTGIAIVHEETKKLLWAAELNHRGRNIKSRLDDRRSIRRNRRSRKTRYRPPRFDNRRRPDGWLPPSLAHRVLTTKTWIRRLRNLTPVTAISYENVRFDTQLMDNPDISGEEYQQGTLHGYEVREYLLDAFDHTCAYCGDKGFGEDAVPLEVEHIIPKSRGGPDRISNLTIACVDCNQEKGNQTAEEYGHPDVQEQVKESLRDVAAVNSTRWALWEALNETGLPVEAGSGGHTKWNRTNQGYPKTHWIDAACVGESGENIDIDSEHQPLIITATGHGSRQICGTDAHGFPIRHRSRQKKVQGMQTGDIVRAEKPEHLKNGGTYIGRISAARASGSFEVRPISGTPPKIGVNAKYCELIQRADGYDYKTSTAHSS